MRPSRSDRGVPVTRRLVALAVSAASLLGARPLSAQTTSTAQFLLLPISARAVGVGGAQVAETSGGDVVLSNPAGLAWLTRQEGALNYGKDLFANRLLGTFVIPSKRAGTFGITATYGDFGEQEATLGPDAAVGRIIPRVIAFGATYAASFGKRLAAGISYNVLQSRFDCVGLCEDPTDPTAGKLPVSTAGAVDAGVQYDFTGKAPLHIGVAVRHVGLKVQVQDREQTDPLPTEASFGARFDVPNVARYVKDAELHLVGEVVTGLNATALGDFRLGAEGVFRKTIALRAGYSYGRSDLGGGPAVGLGYAGKRFAFDLATQFTGLSVDAGQPPTFVALRYWF
jgi:hypothetical protein